MALSDDQGLAGFDGLAQAELVRSGQASALELVDAAIARIEALNPVLNAVIHRQFERARAEAVGHLPDGPFRGVPFLLKDYKGREAGEPYHMGCKALRDIDYRPSSTAPLTMAFRASGLIPLGRTNVPEMALMGTTEPDLYGPTHNPWALDRSPGGSSGGAAAAVAARLVPLAHANDISGSIRIPAAQCGVVGLKPTRGRVVLSSYDPPVGMNAEGVVSISVRDTAAALDAITATSAWWPAPALPRPLLDEVGLDPGRLRIGLWTTAFNHADVDAECAAAAEACGQLLESLGHDVAIAAPAALSNADLWAAARIAMAATAANEAAAWTSRLGRVMGEDDVEPGTWQTLLAGRALSAVDILSALERMQSLNAEALAWWSSFDLLVTPTTAVPGPPLGDYKANYTSGRGSAFTRPFNCTGQPAMSLPLGWPADGLPRGVQLIAGYGREDVLVRVGSQLETAAPWSHHRPPICSVGACSLLS
jgi:amidase